MTEERCRCWKPTELPHQDDCPVRREEDDRLGVWRRAVAEAEDKAKVEDCE